MQFTDMKLQEPKSTGLAGGLVADPGVPEIESNHLPLSPLAFSLLPTFLGFCLLGRLKGRV